MKYLKNTISNLLAIAGFFLVSKFIGNSIYYLVEELLVSFSLMPDFMTLTISSINNWRYMLHDLFTGIFEETAFRYMLYDIVLRKILVFPYKHALVISSILFGLAHFNNIIPGFSAYLVVPQVVMAAFVGIIFAYAYLRKGLWLPIIVHMLYNNSTRWADDIQLYCIIFGGLLTLGIIINYIVVKIKNRPKPKLCQCSKGN